MKARHLLFVVPLVLTGVLLALRSETQAEKEESKAAAKAPAKPKKLESPPYISPTARRVLDERMERHGMAAMRLTVSVILLAYNETREVAEGMASEPGLARPRPGEEGTLNAALPAPFFDFQDQLRARAQELALAAKEKNDAKVGAAMGRLTQTCISCHAAYLKGGGSEEAERKFEKGLDEK